jgi:hypothetical protein
MSAPLDLYRKMVRNLYNTSSTLTVIFIRFVGASSCSASILDHRGSRTQLLHAMPTCQASTTSAKQNIRVRSVNCIVIDLHSNRREDIGRQDLCGFQTSLVAQGAKQPLALFRVKVPAAFRTVPKFPCENLDRRLFQAMFWYVSRLCCRIQRC